MICMFEGKEFLGSWPPSYEWTSNPHRAIVLGLEKAVVGDVLLFDGNVRRVVAGRALNLTNGDIILTVETLPEEKPRGKVGGDGK